MSNFTNRKQQGHQETSVSQSQESQDDRLYDGALKQKVRYKLESRLKTFPTVIKPPHSSQSVHI